MPLLNASIFRPVSMVCFFLFASTLCFSLAPDADPFRPYLGTFWYGAYLQGRKVGHVQAILERSDTDTQSGYTFKISLTLRIHSMGQDVNNRIRLTADFERDAPYALRRYILSEDNDGKIALTRIQRNRGGAGYIARMLQNNQSREQEVGKLDYTFRDVLAVELWLQSKPEVGEVLQHKDLNLDRLQMEDMESRVHAIQHRVISGIHELCYEIETKDSNGSERSTYTSAGKLITGSLSGILELRWESEESARQLDQAVDIFAETMIRTPRPLGPTGELTLLEFTVSEAFGKHLTPATGQTLTFDADTGRYRVLVRQGAGPRIPATAAEIEENLAVTVSFPHEHPKVKDLARRAVGDATHDHEKVKRLVSFVSAYVQDTIHPGHIGLLELIDTPKGDCTEHAQLFTGLARSLGIPARTVSGLGYTDDQLRAFGGHAWNEVVLNGHWVPVDPTWNESSISAGHFRLPIEPNENSRMMLTLASADLEVVRVQGKEFHPHRLIDRADLDRLAGLLKVQPDLLNKRHVTRFADGTVVESATLLHYAVQEGQTAAVKLLLGLGADPGLNDDRGKTPLDLARAIGSPELLKLLEHPAE